MFNTIYFSNNIGGAKKCVQELTGALIRKGLEVVIVNTPDRDNVAFVNKVKVYYVKVPNLYWFCKSKRFSKARQFF
jgi:hypothetical protein